MTAEIVAYNRNAIVLAADSAVTVSGIKAYNTANKLFMLSKYHPVGVLVYNSSAINSISVEVIIKEYRKRLGKKCYSTIQEYKNSFVDFLNKFLSSQITQTDREVSIRSQLNNMLSYIVNRSDIPQVQQGQDFFDVFNSYLDKVYNELKGKIQKDENIDFSLIDLEKELTEIFRSRIKIQDISSDTIKKLIDILPYYINIPLNPNVTGFAICGYGEDEFIPRVYGFETLGFVNNHLCIQDSHTNEDSVSGVIPLAQREMADLFITGIDENVYNFIVNQYNGFIDELISKIPGAYKLLGRYVKTYKNEVSNRIRGVLQENKIDPLLNVINLLSKDELAELAESLVSLQALKHKMSLNIETVGGPIDVAIISKHDGFVWKKRKLYFERDLNTHFFENYFSKDDKCDRISEEVI